MQNFPLKFVLVGDSNVGKSQLSKRFVQNDFSNESVSTVGMQYATKQMPFERCLLNAQVKFLYVYVYLYICLIMVYNFYFQTLHRFGILEVKKE